MLIFENEYFKFYLAGENLEEVHFDSQPRSVQEKYVPDDVLSQDDKIKKLNDSIDYFYNFWKLIETSGDTKIFTMYFNINELMINGALPHLFRLRTIFNSLSSVINTNLKESYFKVENPAAKIIFDLVLTFYTPIKPVYCIS